MPLYEFKCPQCEEAFEERLSSYRNIPEVVCPKCGSESVEKLPSLFATRGCGPAWGMTGLDRASCGGGSGFT